MKQPYVGQIVLFTGRHFLQHSEKNAAIIASVSKQGALVNLNAMNPNGNSYAVSDVKYVSDPSDIVVGENYCQALDANFDTPNAPIVKAYESGNSQDNEKTSGPKVGTVKVTPPSEEKPAV